MKNSKILERIRKLISLSDTEHNPSQEEASTAASMAAELMLKHQISEAQVAGASTEHVVQEVIETVRKRAEWKGILIVGIAKANRTRSYGTRVDNFTESRLIGKPSDILVTREIYEYLCKTLILQSEVAYVFEKCKRRNNRFHKTAFLDSFRRAAAAEIQRRFYNQIEDWYEYGLEQTPGLVVRNIFLESAKANESFITNRGLHLRSGNKIEATQGDGKKAGKEFGASVPINRQVSSGQRGLPSGK